MKYQAGFLSALGWNRQENFWKENQKGKLSTLNAELLDLVVVILAVHDVPLGGAFGDGALLAFDLLPGGSIDLLFLGQQLFHYFAYFQPDGVLIFNEFNVVHLGQGFRD